MHQRVPARALRWRCSPKLLPFASTEDVAPGPRIPGQSLATEALRFAAECTAPCQHVLVRGREDLGGFELALDVLEDADLCGPRPDFAYVRNDDAPFEPLLLALPTGSGAEFRRRVRALGERVARGSGTGGRAIARDFPGEAVDAYLAGVSAFAARRPSAAALRRAFEVNLVGSGVRRDAHVVVETHPSVANLLGVAGVARRDGSNAHLVVQGGSLLRADGGFLLIEAGPLLDEPGGVAALMRTIRTNLVEPHGASTGGFRVRPRPAPVWVRVVLAGEASDCRALERTDPSVEYHFKVLADLDTTMARDARSARVYAQFLARLVREEELRPFDRSGVAALLEHGARIAARAHRVTARLLRIADIAREAECVAREEGSRATRRAHVEAVVARTRRRGSLDAERFQQFVSEGGVLLRVHGEVVGQVNGLSVMDSGPLTYGVPTRITASVAPGTNGIVDVETRADLSGSIHAKGFQILEGLLRSLLLRSHVLSFGASLAFEQTYGRVDGDSASGAEVCCLLSALTGVPVRQGLAMTGSVDQLGHVQAIGGVNEKIEGFFDTCRTLGLDGKQGVIIPRANVGDLMLRPDVVAACRARQFRVHAIDRVHDALELLTGMRAGDPDKDGVYPAGTLLRRAVDRSEEFFRNLSGKNVIPLRSGRRRETVRASAREPGAAPDRARPNRPRGGPHRAPTRRPRVDPSTASG